MRSRRGEERRIEIHFDRRSSRMTTRLRLPRERLGLCAKKLGKGGKLVLETFHQNPAGSQSCPVELDQQPEASLAWRVGNPLCEA